MRILVDADACPVKDEIERLAVRRGVGVIHVTGLGEMKREVPGMRLVRITAGPDAVDDWIAENCEAGDLVITSDIPLASRAVARGALVIEFRGQELDGRNMADRAQMRDLIMALRDRGEMTGGGPPPFTKTDRRNFTHALGRILDRMLAKAEKPPPAKTD